MTYWRIVRWRVVPAPLLLYKMQKTIFKKSCVVKKLVRGHFANGQNANVSFNGQGHMPILVI